MRNKILHTSTPCLPGFSTRSPKIQNILLWTPHLEQASKALQSNAGVGRDGHQMVRCADFAAGRGESPSEARSGMQIWRYVGR